MIDVGKAAASRGTGPLPRPATHENTLLGGRAGERAGAAPSEPEGSDQTRRNEAFTPAPLGHMDAAHV